MSVLPIYTYMYHHSCSCHGNVDRVETLEGYFGVTTRRDGAQGSLFWFEIPYRPDADSATSWKPNEEMLESAGKGTSDSINYSPSPSVKANQTSENKGLGKKTDAKYILHCSTIHVVFSKYRIIYLYIFYRVGMIVKSRFSIFSWWMIRHQY